MIFEKSLEDLEKENYHAPIFRDHIEYIDNANFETYFRPLKEKNKLTLIVRDFIAGMSDKYFSEVYHLYQKSS